MTRIVRFRSDFTKISDLRFTGYREMDGSVHKRSPNKYQGSAALLNFIYFFQFTLLTVILRREKVVWQHKKLYITFSLTLLFRDLWR
jgi:hypothetical protein